MCKYLYSIVWINKRILSNAKHKENLIMKLNCNEDKTKSNGLSQRHAGKTL